MTTLCRLVHLQTWARSSLFHQTFSDTHLPLPQTKQVLPFSWIHSPLFIFRNFPLCIINCYAHATNHYRSLQSVKGRICQFTFVVLQLLVLPSRANA